jgi:hypothetical protein
MATLISRIRADITAVDTKELVQFWNAHNADATIKKFADRKTAERRCLALVATLPEKEEVAKTDLPVHKTRNASKAKAEEAPAADAKPEEEVTEEEALAELRQMREKAKTAPAKDLGKAIAASWGDAEVAAARMTRHNVTVTVNGKTTEHRSVRTAFAEFGLPDSKHIRFRMKLKEEGALAFEHNGIVYEFRAFEANADKE